MNAYIYKAAFYCEACTREIKQHLASVGKAPINTWDEQMFDSDHYPKGPYSDGGGESDSPQHCDACGLFLENPLTIDGANYVRDIVARRPDSEHAKEYQEFYSYLW